jgi:hypothetical protein
MINRLKLLFGIFCIFINVIVFIMSTVFLISTFPVWLLLWLFTGYNIYLAFDNKMDKGVISRTFIEKMF